MSDEKGRNQDGSLAPPLSSSSSLGNQLAPNDVWNNPQLLDLKQEIDLVAGDIKAKEGELKKLRREKRQASADDKADFQEEIDELKQSIADLKAEKLRKEEERRDLTQSLSGNTGQAFNMELLLATLKEKVLAPVEEQRRRDRFAPAIEVRRFNEGASFWTQGNLSMSTIISQAQQRLSIRGVLVNPRFYIIPPGGFDENKRIVIRSQSEWKALIDRQADAEDPTPVQVYFVFSRESPPPSLPTTPPRGPSIVDLDDDVKSENSNISELNSRDGSKCVVCGIDPVENAHIIDESRSELLLGLDNINSLENHIQLCRNHHWSFDHHQFLLVPRSDRMDCTEFSIALGAGYGTEPPSCIRDYVGKTVSFSNSAQATPLPHLFLVKQLGQYQLCCHACGRANLTPNGFPNHKCTSESKERPLPHPCQCKQSFDTIKTLFNHMQDHHLNMLYYHPAHASSSSSLSSSSSSSSTTTTTSTSTNSNPSNSSDLSSFSQAQPSTLFRFDDDSYLK